MPPFPELKDISPPTPPPFSSPEEIQELVWFLFAGFTTLLLLAALWWWWRRRVRQSQPPPLPLPALEHLRQSLATLQPLADARPASELGQNVGDAIRHYLQRQHGLLARYRTTEELFGTTRARHRTGAPPPLPFLRPFQDVLTQCDALKFAGASSPLHQRTSLVLAALAATESVRASLLSPPQNITPPPLPPPLPPSPASPEPPPIPADTSSAAPSSLASSSPASSSPASSSPASSSPASSSPASSSPAPSPPNFSPLPPTLPRFQSDAFTHPQPCAFARGADVIPT